MALAAGIAGWCARRKYQSILQVFRKFTPSDPLPSLPASPDLFISLRLPLPSLLASSFVNITLGRREHVANEILTTERTFVTALQVLTNVFMIPMRYEERREEGGGRREEGGRGKVKRGRGGSEDGRDRKLILCRESGILNDDAVTSIFLGLDTILIYNVKLLVLVCSLFLCSSSPFPFPFPFLSISLSFPFPSSPYTPFLSLLTR